MKICFKKKAILDFNLHCKFRPIWTCFSNIIKKTGKLISLDCILDQVFAVIMESTIFCYITKSFCPETLKFLRDGFYWNPCWNRCEHRDDRVSVNKWESFYWDINHQSRVITEQRNYRNHRNYLLGNSFLKKVAGVNLTTLLRLEFLCESFSRVFVELSEDLKAVE